MIDWLLGTLLATSALILFVLLVREPVRRYFGARVAYGLWLIPAARLLMPPITQTIERPVIDAPASTILVPQILSEPRLLSAVEATEPSLLELLGGWSTIALIMWLGVAAGMLVKAGLTFRRERAIILDSSVSLARLGSIRLVRSPVVKGPLAFGIIDKVIAVPVDFDRRFTDGERRLALDHELSHHRSGDLVVNFVALVLLCLQWFNPLAWAAYAAFRFDQEAACDARVLDSANKDDRVDYGRAIAKAASGRAMLFASALDKRSTLQRRLSSMLGTISHRRRKVGGMLLIVIAGIAVPLTASRAIQYVDVPQAPRSPAPVAPVDAAAAPMALAAVAPVAALAPVAATAPVAPIAPALPTDAEPIRDLDSHQGKRIFVHGKETSWTEMTPEDRAELRRGLAEAREELRKIDREKIKADVRRAIDESRRDREQWRRDIKLHKADIDRAMREIDRNADSLRRAGHSPEQIKATVQASLSRVRMVDVDAITRRAMESIDERQIEASVEAADRAIDAANAEIERAEALERDE
jgi:bla regulator protein BlaR1